MDIHIKINMRADYEEFINMTNDLYKRFNIKNPNKPVNLNLISLVIKGREKHIEQGLKGMYKCNECSNQARSDIYHFNSPVFNEFNNTPIIKKHANNIQELANYFYN